jgi:hypothetical protein
MEKDWYILWPFGICILQPFSTFNGHLIIYWQFGIFPIILVFCVKKNLAAQVTHCPTILFARTVALLTSIFGIFPEIGDFNADGSKNRLARLNAFHVLNVKPCFRATLETFWGAGEGECRGQCDRIGRNFAVCETNASRSF